jgi:hypothetical protein
VIWDDSLQGFAHGCFPFSAFIRPPTASLPANAFVRYNPELLVQELYSLRPLEVGESLVASLTCIAAPGLCEAYGYGVGDGPAGEESMFVLVLRNPGGQEIAGAPVKDVKVAVNCKEAVIKTQWGVLPSGEYRLAIWYCRPRRAGEYSLDVLLQGEHIKDSPFKLESVPTILEPLACTVEGGGKDISRAYAHTLTKFLIVTRDKYGMVRLHFVSILLVLQPSG